MSRVPEDRHNRRTLRERINSAGRSFNRWRAELNEAYNWEEESSEEDELTSLSASSTSRSESWAEHQRRSEVARMTGMNLDDVEVVENYNEKDNHGPSIFLTEAMRKSRKIQKRWPKRLLCGGLALYLYGVIKRERFSDLDFVSFEENVIDNECISLECSKPYTHCLFLSPDVEAGSVVEGIMLQKLDQILYWKMRYNRPKDQKDLKDYLDKQFLTADDFKL